MLKWQANMACSSGGCFVWKLDCSHQSLFTNIQFLQFLQTRHPVNLLPSFFYYPALQEIFYAMSRYCKHIYFYQWLSNIGDELIRVYNAVKCNELATIPLLPGTCFSLHDSLTNWQIMSIYLRGILAKLWKLGTRFLFINRIRTVEGVRGMMRTPN